MTIGLQLLTVEVTTLTIAVFAGKQVPRKPPRGYPLSQKKLDLLHSVAASHRLRQITFGALIRWFRNGLSNESLSSLPKE